MIGGDLIGRFFAGGVMAMTMACTTVPPVEEENLPEKGVVAGRICDASRIQDLVGRAATQELGADAVRRSGAAAMRWLRPGDIVTMEYSPSRLNIHLDAQNRVARLVCG